MNQLYIKQVCSFEQNATLVAHGYATSIHVEKVWPQVRIMGLS